MFSPLRKNPKRSGFKSPRDPISNDFISTSTSTLHPNDPPGYPEHSSHYIKPVPPRYITEYERAYTWPKQFGEEPKDEMKEEKGKDIVPKDLSTSNNIDRYSDLEDIIHHHRHFIKPIEPTYVTEYERAYCSAGNTPQSSPKGTLNKDLMFDKSFEHPSDESPYSPLKLQTKIRDIATTDKNITKINDEKNEIKNIKSDKIENKDISQEKVTISEVWIEMEKIIDELNKKGYDRSLCSVLLPIIHERKLDSTIDLACKKFKQMLIETEVSQDDFTRPSFDNEVYELWRGFIDCVNMLKGQKEFFSIKKH